MLHKLTCINGVNLRKKYATMVLPYMDVNFVPTFLLMGEQLFKTVGSEKKPGYDR